MGEERGKFQFAGLRFVYDLELVDDPVLINNLKMNILDVSNWIQDVELLSSYNHRSMLIYLKMGWVGRKFLQKTIEPRVLDIVKQLLPRFKFRVVTDRKILDLALKRVEIALKGDMNENSIISVGTSNTSTKQSQLSGTSIAAENQSELQEEPSVLQDPQTKADDR